MQTLPQLHFHITAQQLDHLQVLLAAVLVLALLVPALAVVLLHLADPVQAHLEVPQAAALVVVAVPPVVQARLVVDPVHLAARLAVEAQAVQVDLVLVVHSAQHSNH